MSTYNIKDNNMTDYTRDKKKCEEIIKSFQHKIIRLPTIIEIKNNNVIMGGKGAALEKIFKFEKYFRFVPLIGDGNYTHNFCLIDDLYKILNKIISEEIKGDLIIVKNSNKLSFKELIIKIFEIKGKKIKILFIPLVLFNFIMKVMHFLKLKRNFGQDNLIELINKDEQKHSDIFILKNFEYKNI